MLAHIAGEDVLKEIFIRGEDVHTATASRVFQVEAHEIDPGMRSKSKMINYGIVYGLSDYGLADRLNIPREEAKAFIDAYLERFPAVAAFIAGDDRAGAREQGYVTTLFGRRRQIPELRARNYGVRTLGERLAVNTVDPGHRGRRDEARDGRASTARCASAGSEDAHDPHDPRRAALRGPGRTRWTRSREIARARDVRAVGRRASRRSPSTSASGATWLEAK